MKVGLIYLIKNLKNNKQYIGITTRPIETRVYDHIYKSKYKGNIIIATTGFRSGYFL